MTRRAVIIASILASSAPVFAERVTVKVIEVASGVAYVEPGRTAGIVPGIKVLVGHNELVVIEATDKTAVVKLDRARVAVGDTGTVDITPGSVASAGHKLAAPHPLDTWKEQWTPAVLPSTIQSPKQVPLGDSRPAGRVHLSFIGHGYGEVDKTGVDGEAEVRMISSFDVMSDRPLAADADVAVRGFATGWNKGANTPLFVRALQLRYGDVVDPQVAIGRLRYAASAVGMLDGGRAAMRFGTFELAAFGGLVPDPVSGKPDTSAARFGAEAAYDDTKSTWQPRVGVTAYGSTWNGASDERRVSLAASANHEAMYVSGWADAQSFPSGNPFGASGVELTGAGATGEWRHDGQHIGIDALFLRPERSLRLLATLPPEWSCTRAAQRGDVMNETCGSDDYWTAASASAGTRQGPWTIDAIGSIGTTHGQTHTVDMSGYLRGELHFGHQRLELGAASGRSSFVRWISGEVGFATAPSRRYDLALRYRPELLDYSAGTQAYLIHSLSLDLRYAASSTMDLGVSALATTGADRDALVLLTTIAYRPLP